MENFIMPHQPESIQAMIHSSGDDEEIVLARNDFVAVMKAKERKKKILKQEIPQRIVLASNEIE
ncbi:CLUMA_CG019916, isoform A [Clunio marinus]|uniref:CLUMA_CG019916, isoform A n=1 Tax=Clunio marinus TaxID=568069 RepID=A0A1J1J1Q9_9DIPT|nr:CLUMA_CG019916, isoform A [Clunio marinus]